MRVLVVDDHPLLRQGLSDLLGALPDVEAVTTVPDGSGAAAAAVDGAVDVVLMDLSMPGTDGLVATREVVAARPGARVVVLTTFAENDRILAALDAGAVGYLLKDAEPEEIIRAVRDAAAGHAPFSARAAAALVAERRPRAAAPETAPGTGPVDRVGPADVLTAREREVLALVATGLPNKSVARRLDISEKTVKAHLTRVFTAIGVGDRTSAALWAQRHGLTHDADL
ncbi:response regulator [Pseudokineococcus lusitanus]|uniref:LuxR family two component transcriptional regulator n=1 Tax=Pseudokineococcus lusitanus TaxID=763993 RepID=A0A3N1GAN2_9ACTN|nr:response regulator transcription factor [Pseudokineococcus lusitanus]ROP27238.1 LuxR family two component transcriptional regulator [Pseudokineococcus lusitanus]